MNIKRMRGRNHRPGGGGNGGGGAPIRHQSGNVPLNRNHVFDSSGPDVRVRGTSQQLFEKYLQMGRDATSGGDRVMAEGYFQHAEHYFRILNAMNQAVQQGQQNGQQQNGQHNGQAGPQHGGPRRFQNDGDYAGQNGQNGNQGSFGQNFSADGDDADNGNEQRIEARNEPRPEPRFEPRSEHRPEPRPESRSESRQEHRVEPRPEPRMEAQRRMEAPVVAEVQPPAVPQATVEAAPEAPVIARPEPRIRQRREPRAERPALGNGASGPPAAAPGTGDQPEARDIPIIVAPPEG